MIVIVIIVIIIIKHVGRLTIIAVYSSILNIDGPQGK